jgi:hypothetical protein
MSLHCSGFSDTLQGIIALENPELYGLDSDKESFVYQANQLRKEADKLTNLEAGLSVCCDMPRIVRPRHWPPSLHHYGASGYNAALLPGDRRVRGHGICGKCVPTGPAWPSVPALHAAVPNRALRPQI